MGPYISIARKYLTLISAALLFGCAHEPDFSAPLVQTGKVINITEEGVTLVGMVTYTGSGAGEAGFVWNVTPNPILGNAFNAVLPKVSKGPIELRVTSGLENLVTYFVRAYGKSGNQIVYGETVSFVSLGSLTPILESFSPHQGSPGTTITISGKNFTSNKSDVDVRLGGIPLEVLSSSRTIITAKVPTGFLFSGLLELTVTITNITIIAPDEFTVSGPKVTGFAPSRLIGGDTLTVTGSGFSSTLSEVTVWIGANQLNLIATSGSEIKAILPVTIIPAESKVYVYKNLIRCESKASISVVSPWESILTSASRPDPTYRAVQFLIGSLLYSGVAGSNTFYNYDPLLNAWASLSPYAGSGSVGTFGFSLGSSGYVGLGNFAGIDVWQYNSLANSWTQLSDFPGARQSPANFVVNGKAYVGLGQNGSTSLTDFYEFNHGTGGWIRLGDFPGSYSRIDGSFVLGNKSYVIAGKNFWAYEPSTDHWQQLGDTPSSGVRQSLASVDGHGYLIGGYNGSIPLNQVWEYHAQNDTWQRRPSPGPLGGASTIGIGGKIYAIGGVFGDGSKNQILIYNPHP